MRHSCIPTTHQAYLQSLHSLLMMAPSTVNDHATPKKKNTRKRALSTAGAATTAEKEKPAKRAKANTSTNTSAQVELTGPFDLLYTHSTFSKEYAPDGKDTTNPEGLYKMMLARQEDESTKDAWTAHITIPADYQTNSTRKNASFTNSYILEPMSEAPFDLVATDFKHVPKPTFKTKFGRPSAEDGVSNAAGIKAALELAGGGKCGVSSASGTLALRPLWRKIGEDGKVMELFEGNFTFKAKFNSLYSRAGFGKGVSYSHEFWAIRGKN